MADEDVIGRGGSLIFTYCDGKKELNKRRGQRVTNSITSKGTIVKCGGSQRRER